MLKKSGRIIGLFLSFFSISAYAMVCTHDDDCTEWGYHHCICGVRAHCVGKIVHSGRCHCFGAQGRCPKHKSRTPSTYGDILPKNALPTQKSGSTQ